MNGDRLGRTRCLRQPTGVCCAVVAIGLREGRKRVSPRFGSGKWRTSREGNRGKIEIFRVLGPILVRNPMSGSGAFLRAERARIPRFEKSKRGKFERDFFARGQKRVLEWRATQSYIAAARETGVVRARLASRATRGDHGADECRVIGESLCIPVPHTGPVGHRGHLAGVNIHPPLAVMLSASFDGSRAGLYLARARMSHSASV